MWSHAQSLYLLSLVNAIECLAVDASDRINKKELWWKALVETLRRKQPGLFGRFKAFMRAFAPGNPISRALAGIYDLRSDITHGATLLAYDRSGALLGLDQVSGEHRQVMDYASVLTRGALLNWLWSRGEVQTAPLVTRGVDQTKPAKPGTTRGFTVVVPDGA